MPKIKTHKGTAKVLKVRKSGKGNSLSKADHNRLKNLI